MYCKNCGNENEDEALFCGECGAPLMPPKTPVKKKKMDMDYFGGSAFSSNSFGSYLGRKR